MSFRAVVFDLDGTLIDSRGDIAAACNAMLAQLGRAELPEETIHHFVGDGARLLVARALELPLEHPDVDGGLELFLSHYEANPVARTAVLPGVEESLAYCERAGLLVGLCTNKPRRTTLPILRALGWTERFGAVVAGGDTVEKKPHAEPVLLAAQLLAVPPSAVIMVGDGPQDVGAGRAAGAFTIGLRGGILPEHRLLESQPDLLLDSLEQLPGWLSGR